MTATGDASRVPVLVLNDGNAVPVLGFGVWQIPDSRAQEAVRTALEVGYRSIDTAAVYGNEQGTGRGIRESGVPREELFVTSKVWNDDQGYDATLRAFEASLGRLGLDYLDLYLIHWPDPGRGRYLETFRAIQRLAADGALRSIGVSNFTEPLLARLIDETGAVPAVNQVELHPYLIQSELRRYHESHAIATEAWSPLGSGVVLDNPTIRAIAAELGRTPAQVVIRWHLQLGVVVIPKSERPERIRGNFDVFGFELTPAQMAAIDGLDSGTRTGPDPAVWPSASPAVS